MVEERLRGEVEALRESGWSGAREKETELGRGAEVEDRVDDKVEMKVEDDQV